MKMWGAKYRWTLHMPMAGVTESDRQFAPAECSVPFHF